MIALRNEVEIRRLSLKKPDESEDQMVYNGRGMREAFINCHLILSNDNVSITVSECLLFFAVILMKTCRSLFSSISRSEG